MDVVISRCPFGSVSSLLDLTEHQWRHRAGFQVREAAPFLTDARNALESLCDGTGWEIEHPKDVWRLHKLPGIAVPAGRPCPRARLRFDRVTQPWLRELAKRLTRLRLISGLSIGAARGRVDALICFSRFLTVAGVDALAEARNRPESGEERAPDEKPCSCIPCSAIAQHYLAERAGGIERAGS